MSVSTWVKLPNGTVSNLDTGASFSIIGTNIAYQAPGNVQGYSIPCGSSASAAALIAQLITATSATVIASTPTFSGITSTSYVHNTAAIFTVTGTGFMAAGFYSMKLVSGGNVVVFDPPGVPNDTTAYLDTADASPLPASGTYELWYSLDGTNYTDAGKSVVIT